MFVVKRYVWYMYKCNYRFYVIKYFFSVLNLINNIYFEFKKKLFVLFNFILIGDKYI